MNDISVDDFDAAYEQEKHIGEIHKRGYVEVNEESLELFIDTLKYFSQEAFTLITVSEKLFFRSGLDHELSIYGNKVSFIVAGDSIVPWRHAKKEKPERN